MELGIYQEDGCFTPEISQQYMNLLISYAADDVEGHCSSAPPKLSISAFAQCNGVVDGRRSISTGPHYLYNSKMQAHLTQGNGR